MVSTTSSALAIDTVGLALLGRYLCAVVDIDAGADLPAQPCA